MNFKKLMDNEVKMIKKKYNISTNEKKKLEQIYNRLKSAGIDVD